MPGAGNSWPGNQCPKHVFILENLPLGHSGKIDKQAIRQRALERIAGDANPKPPLITIYIYVLQLFAGRARRCQELRLETEVPSRISGEMGPQARQPSGK